MVRKLYFYEPLDMDTRLRVGRAIGKTEEQVAHELMAQLKERGQPDQPPVMATDGKGDYRTALLETWGEVPACSHEMRNEVRLTW